MSIESVMTSNHLILCHPLLLAPSIFSSIRIFSSESVLCIMWPSIGVSASASVLPMNIQDWFPLRLTGLISFEVLGTLRSLLQHHSSKASILWCSAFFIVQLSHPYMASIALARWNLSFRAWLIATVSNYAWSHQEMVTVVYFTWAFRDQQEFAKRKVHQASLTDGTTSAKVLRPRRFWSMGRVFFH